ncbi:MAG: L,D-transpeptidase family protein [Rhizobiales bacterium]|nr:L,D-transpeptidase family protein [Hyphomicrobiales bacterium]OJY43488.1 MAG: hypothetical protein BGP08_01550 [Rhizobiales bacterium 64-17]
MLSSRLNRLLTGSAVAVVLTLGAAQAALAQSTSGSSEPAMVDGVPVPDTTMPAPPTVEDLNRSMVPATPAPAAQAPAAQPAPAAAEAPKAAPAAPATAATPAPAAAPVTASLDNAVSDKLRELSSGKFDRILGSKKERTAVEAFYSARNFKPLWVTDGAANAGAKAAAKYLGGVEADALDPSDYPTPDFTAAKDADALAEAEMKLTNSVLAFSHHASIGRVHFTRISADISYDLKAPEPGDVLKKLADASDVAAALDSFNPQQPGYKALKAKYAELRAGKKADTGPAPIPHGATLKLDTPKKKKNAKKGAKVEETTAAIITDDRVPEIRKRLGVTGDQSSNVFDKDVVAALRGFQKEHKLPANGQLTNATVDAINGPKQNVNAQDAIVATMERWRWMPRDLGNPYVMVNIPDYSLRIVKDGKTYWKTKIVVGQPGKPTPIISAEMKFITVNPTWNVPPSIIQNEYLPALREDPNALDRIGLKVSQNPDGTVRIWQPPGDRNALGRIRFNFPNKFLVYQHDTPDKHLFAHDKRAYSHGCMRVQDPLMYGEKILSLALPQEHYTAARLQKMFGGNEININFPKTIPVHLTYQTAFVDDDGKLQVRGDVYGRDARVLAALRGSERKVADIPMDRPPNTSARPVKLAPGSLGGQGPSYGGGPNFFDWLFGAPSREPQYEQRPQRRRYDNNGRISYR